MLLRELNAGSVKSNWDLSTSDEAKGLDRDLPITGPKDSVSTAVPVLRGYYP